MKYIKLFITAALIILISSCHEELSYNYLIQHPDVLKSKLDDCQSAANLHKQLTPQCELVFYATANFMSVYEEAGNDPEKLGQQVLDAEGECVKAKSAYQTAQQTLDDLTKGNAAASEIQTAKDNLEKTKKAYEDKNQEIRF